ncbi:MAG: hypothetical protein LQ343_000270 [Gyalolechia ehrenbergii]|nr:MAG: hypothetical protein LQ343_000270 [Gyalolechia ehrenbergii]
MMMGRSPTSASAASTSGAHHQEFGSFGYPQSAQYPPAQIQSSSMQFPPDYNQGQPRSQNFPQYTSQMVYNVPQQPHARSSYDAVPQYQPRQSASLEVISNQFGVPSYYQAGEAISPSGQPSPDPQYPSSQFHPSISYQTPGPRGQTIPTVYPAGMAEYPHSVAQEVVEQQQEPEGSSHQEELNQYQEMVRQVFEHSSQGRLSEAAELLLRISRWLLSRVKELGLVSDDQSLREGRLKLWDEFNKCWLAVLQRQMDDTRQMLDRGQPPSAAQNILPEAFLKEMGDALVQQCDAIEKYGLVDYQMGVWEEEIMSSKVKRSKTEDSR